MIEKEKYFVASEGGLPTRIFFNSLDAFISGYEYVDVFGESGMPIKSYKFVDNEYTTDF